MRSNRISWLIIVASVLCLAIGVYYLVPGIYHPFTFSGQPADSHHTHDIAFLALGLVALIGSRFMRASSRE